MVITIIYFVGVYSKGFPVDSSPCIYLYFSFRPLVGGGFPILRGWCAVGLIPEGLGLMAFSLVPGWRKIGDGVLSLPSLALHVVFVPS